MGRWESDAHGRLAQAAIELYGERGYAATAVADIAERAGLTERTFFRHFANKREVLFGGAGELQEQLVTGVRESHPSTAPLDAVASALEATGPFFAELGPHVRVRQRLLDENPELHERELTKLDSLAAALSDALRVRGVGDPDAAVAATAGVAVFQVAFARWTHSDNGATLVQTLRDCFASLSHVTEGVTMSDGVAPHNGPR